MVFLPTEVLRVDIYTLKRYCAQFYFHLGGISFRSIIACLNGKTERVCGTGLGYFEDNIKIRAEIIQGQSLPYLWCARQRTCDCVVKVHCPPGRGKD